MTWDSAFLATGFIADLAAALTAVVAVWLWLRVVFSAHKRRRKLETYLKEQRENSGDQGMRTILHLMSNLSMTEEQIYSAAFSSKFVSAVPMSDKLGFAKDILFIYLPPHNRFSAR